MRPRSRRTLIGLIVLGVLVLAALSYFGIRRYDVDLELLDRRERCVAISQSIAPQGANEAERSQLERCRAEGWAG